MQGPTDGRTYVRTMAWVPYYKLTLSLRLWWANNNNNNSLYLQRVTHLAKYRLIFHEALYYWHLIQQSRVNKYNSKKKYIYIQYIGLSVYLSSCLVSFKQDKSDTSLDLKCNSWFNLAESETQELKTDYLLMSSADKFCKKFGPRSGLAKCPAWSGIKLFMTLWIYSLSAAVVIGALRVNFVVLFGLILYFSVDNFLDMLGLPGLNK